jgi:hypothetical protein
MKLKLGVRGPFEAWRCHHAVLRTPSYEALDSGSPMDIVPSTFAIYLVLREVNQPRGNRPLKPTTADRCKPDALCVSHWTRTTASFWIYL